MSHDPHPEPERIPEATRNVGRHDVPDRSDVDLDLDLRVTPEDQEPDVEIVVPSAEAQKAREEAEARARAALERARAIDAHVGSLLGRLETVLGPSRRMALSNLLGSDSLSDMLAAGPEHGAPDHDAILTPGDLDAVAGELQTQREKYDDRIFKFGIVGFQSSGKSYLISALFDQLHFLPSLDEATTSVVTRIRYPFAHESTDVITVLFHDQGGKREFIAFLNQVNATERMADPIRFTDHPGEAKISADYAAKDFFLKCNNPRRDLAKYRLISEVHILKDSPFLTDYTEIIDLPGLGGPYALLDETTMQYLDEVDAVLFISSVNHNWVAKDTEIFSAFASRPNVFKKVFFVLSKLDMPGSDLEKSIHTFHSLLDEFVSPDLPRDRVFYCSAWTALYNRLKNPAQRGNLDNVRKSFESQDPHSFFKVKDAHLHARLQRTFTPQDGGVRELRDGLYNFFSTHKRLLQLNEVLTGLSNMLGRTNERFDGMLHALGGAGSQDADALERELYWIERRQNQLLEEARFAFSGNGNGNGNGHGPLFAPWTRDRIASQIDDLMPQLMREAGFAEEPERRRERREAAAVLGPKLGHELAGCICSDRSTVLAGRYKGYVADRMEPYVQGFPEAVQYSLGAPMHHWQSFVHAALRMLLGPRLLEACRPAEGAAEEMDPFVSEFRHAAAENVRSTLDRVEGEWPGALVAAWDTLRVRMGDAFQDEVAGFYRSNPDAPRPLVDSPEALVLNLQRICDELAGCHDTAIELDHEVHEALDSLR